MRQNNAETQYHFWEEVMDKRVIRLLTLAVAIALQGGVGFIHCSQDIKDQAEQVSWVKRFENGFIVSPYCIGPKGTLEAPLGAKNRGTGDAAAKNAFVESWERDNYNFRQLSTVLFVCFFGSRWAYPR